MSEPAPSPNQQTAGSISAAVMDLLYAFVLPLFAGFLEPDAAERAARNAIRSYQPRTHHEAMLAARTIAFGLATQDNLRLCMAADLTVNMKLRLRANANALDRSAERNHAALEKCQATRAATPDEAELADMLRDSQNAIAQANADIAAAKAVAMPNPRRDSAPAPVVAPAQAAAAGRPAQAPTSQPVPPPAKAAAAPAAPAAVAAAQNLQPPRMADPRDKLLWADAMTRVAAEMTADLSAIPPAHRKQELMRARLLGSTASEVTMLATSTAAPRQIVAAPEK